MCFLSHALPRQVLDFPPNAKEVVSKAFWISPGMKWDKTFYNRPSDFTKVPTRSVSAQPCFLRIFSFPLNLHICLSDNCCKMDMTLIFSRVPGVLFQDSTSPFVFLWAFPCPGIYDHFGIVQPWITCQPYHGCNGFFAVAPKYGGLRAHLAKVGHPAWWFPNLRGHSWKRHITRENMWKR